MILLDMILPGLDGWKVLRAVRQDARLAPIHVIIMTGAVLTREWTEVEGCGGFLHKPFSEEELLDEV